MRVWGVFVIVIVVSFGFVVELLSRGLFLGLWDEIIVEVDEVLDYFKISRLIVVDLINVIN